MSVVVGVPWEALQHGHLKQGLVILGERTALPAAPPRCLAAFVALGMIELRIRRNRRPLATMAFEFSEDACISLAEELTNIECLQPLRDSIIAALAAHEEDKKNARTGIGHHCRRPVRGLRRIHGQRPEMAVGERHQPTTLGRRDWMRSLQPESLAEGESGTGTPEHDGD